MGKDQITVSRPLVESLYPGEQSMFDALDLCTCGHAKSDHTTARHLCVFHSGCQDQCKQFAPDLKSIDEDQLETLIWHFKTKVLESLKLEKPFSVIPAQLNLDALTKEQKRRKNDPRCEAV